MIVPLSLLTPQREAYLDEPETHPPWIASAVVEEWVSRGVGVPTSRLVSSPPQPSTMEEGS